MSKYFLKTGIAAAHAFKYNQNFRVEMQDFTSVSFMMNGLSYAIHLFFVAPRLGYKRPYDQYEKGLPEIQVHMFKALQEMSQKRYSERIYY